jgi:hypothetical protein
MAIVSNNPGGYGGALGVITLEDVIESLIGEEIVDETDIFVDVHRKIKVNRPSLAPAKRYSSNGKLNTDIIHSPSSLTIKSSDTHSSKPTGIKIRMKGYGAIVDTLGGNSNSTILSTSNPQQNNNFNNELKI